VARMVLQNAGSGHGSTSHSRFPARGVLTKKTKVIPLEDSNDAVLDTSKRRGGRMHLGSGHLGIRAELLQRRT